MNSESNLRNVAGHGFRAAISPDVNPEDDVAGGPIHGDPKSSDKDVEHEESHGGLLLVIREGDHTGS